MLTIRYFDRDKNEQVELKVNVAMDVVGIIFSESDNLPPLKVDVNSDGVIVSLAESGELIQRHEYLDMLAEAAGDD